MPLEIIWPIFNDFVYYPQHPPEFPNQQKSQPCPKTSPIPLPPYPSKTQSPSNSFLKTSQNPKSAFKSLSKSKPQIAPKSSKVSKSFIIIGRASRSRECPLQKADRLVWASTSGRSVHALHYSKTNRFQCPGCIFLSISLTIQGNCWRITQYLILAYMNNI